jgi:hypothetical protein
MSEFGGEPENIYSHGVFRILTISEMRDKNKEGLDGPQALFNNRRCTFASVVILPRNVLASVVRHERRRHKAYYRASGDVDGNRVAGVIGGE